MSTDDTTEEPKSTEDQFCHAARHYDSFALDHERLESLRTIHRLSGELLAAAGEPVDAMTGADVFAEISAERDAQEARWTAEVKKPNVTRAFCSLWILDLLPKSLDGTLTQIDENAWTVRIPPEALGPPADPIAYRGVMKQIAAYAVTALEVAPVTEAGTTHGDP